MKNEDVKMALIWDFSHRAQIYVRGLLETVRRLERLHLLVVDVSQDAGQDLQQEDAQQQGEVLQERSGEGRESVGGDGTAKPHNLMRERFELQF